MWWTVKHVKAGRLRLVTIGFRALYFWKQGIEEEKRHAKLFRVLCGRWTKTTLWKAFNKWGENIWDERRMGGARWARSSAQP